jgi:hypothetical protein
MSNPIEYHLERARCERHIAYRSADPRVSDAHMDLSALHLNRALLLQEVLREPVGNVSPLRPALDSVSTATAPAPLVRLIELPSR